MTTTPATHAADLTRLVRRRYDRMAYVYDVLEWPMERSARHWRRQLWSRVACGRVLELGIGTGKNMPWYAPGTEVTGVDLSPRMLERARRRAQGSGIALEVVEADVQALPFPDASFDSVVATFLFCSVPDPVRGLQEARRVLVPGGQLLLLEHVLSRGGVLRWLMQRLDPVTVRLSGAHIDRETVDNVRAAGFRIVEEDDLVLDIVKRIEARPVDARAPLEVSRRPGADACMPF